MTQERANTPGALPNFFIVGAPKCGTTALSEYLRAHPDIFMSEPKEPHYFAGDVPKPLHGIPVRGVTDWDDYLNLFREAEDNYSKRGEASVWYLYSSIAAPRIREVCPDARIVVMLRNPVDMVHSLHSQLLYTQIETESDFERAWDLKDEGRDWFLRYGEIGRLGAQLQRLLTTFPREQVKVVLFDNFRSHTRLVYEDVLSFLGLATDNRRHFPRINENKRNRSGTIATFVRDTPAPLSAAVGGLKRVLGIRKLGILNRLQHLNTETTRRRAMSPTLRSEIATFFRDDITLLEEVLGHSLSHWKRT